MESDPKNTEKDLEITIEDYTLDVEVFGCEYDGWFGDSSF